jgi:uncharacterized protein (TIGR02271 family)
MNELLGAGFARTSVRIMLGDKSTRRVSEWREDQPSAVGTAGRQNVNGDASETLISVGVPNTDARNYEEALHRGHALVSVSTTDDRIDQAVDIMNRHNILDLHDRMRTWGGAGNGHTLDAGEEAAIPVIEEEVRVGKREVESGGVRVRAHVTETPVEETVNLRQEHVEVERHPVNRPATASDINNMRDRTFEVHETAEEAVVNKQARVVEEVVVSKEADTHQEQIRDTVRRTDVDVEQVPGDRTDGWDRYRNDFETHYRTNYANTGRSFATYEPAYRYGYGLAGRSNWRGRTWTQIEPEVRRDWESRNQGPWEDFKDAVRNGWERITS